MLLKSATSCPSKEIKWFRFESSDVFFDRELADSLDRIYYRYATFPELLDLVVNRSMTMLDPREWRDKYERHVTSQVFSEAGPFAKNRVYAKCFSDSSSSEALWRLFATHGPVFRYGVKLNLLLEAFRRSLGDHGKIYVSTVRYSTPNILRLRLADFAKTGKKPVSKLAAEQLFYKRNAFEFESELRVILISRAGSESKSFTLDNFEFEKLTRILIDPYAPPWHAQSYRRLLKDALKLKTRVDQSTFDKDV